MSAKITALHASQPEDFAFTPENLREAQTVLARYPAHGRQSAVIPLLALAQAQNGNWLPKAAMDYIAGMLGMAPVRVYEVASFYTMYNLEPVGRHVIQICTTTPCWLKDSEAIVKACEKRLGVALGETTHDGEFTLREVECLGACVNAPMAQVISVNGTQDFYEDLTPQNVTRLIDAFARGEAPKPGPQSARKSSEPEGYQPPKSGAGSHSQIASAPTATAAQTERDTTRANAPGIHPEGNKRYSGETKSDVQPPSQGEN